MFSACAGAARLQRPPTAPLPCTDPVPLRGTAPASFPHGTATAHWSKPSCLVSPLPCLSSALHLGKGSKKRSCSQGAPRPCLAASRGRKRLGRAACGIQPQAGACPASVGRQNPQGLPQVLLPGDRAQDKRFKSATPEETSRCPWGSSEAVQALEVLFRILQAPEGVRSPSHSLWSSAMGAKSPEHLLVLVSRDRP